MVSLIVPCMKLAIGALQANNDVYCQTWAIGMLPMVALRNNKPYLNRLKLSPQTIEWLFAQTFGRKFRVSLDNLTGEGGDGAHLKTMSLPKLQRYFNGEAKLPRDAKRLLNVFVTAPGGKTLQIAEFERKNLD